MASKDSGNGSEKGDGKTAENTSGADNVVDFLKSTHFGDPGTNVPAAGDPVMETMLVLTLDQLTEYSRNPRKSPNAEYDTLKASYLKTGADKTLLVVTKRPGEELYFPAAGGNTRLRILKELWEETGDGKYFRINCKFVPWVDESQVLIDHLSENDNRSDYIFIDRAKGICELYERMESEQEGSLSQRAFISRMLDLGYPKLSRQQLLRFQYAVELYKYIPEALDGGMHLRAIDRLKELLADLRTFISNVGSGYTEIPEAFDEQWKWELDKLDSPEGIDLDALPGMIFVSLAPVVSQRAPELALDEVPARLKYLWRDWSADKSLSVSLHQDSASKREKYNPTRSGPTRHFGPEEAEKEFGDHYRAFAGGGEPAAQSGSVPVGGAADRSSPSPAPGSEPPFGENAPPPSGPDHMQGRRKMLEEENIAHALSIAEAYGFGDHVHSIYGGITGYWVDLPGLPLKEFAVTAWWFLWDISQIADHPEVIPAMIRHGICTGSRLERHWLVVADGRASLRIEEIKALPEDRRNPEFLKAFRHLVESGISPVSNQSRFLLHCDQAEHDALIRLVANVRKLEDMSVEGTSR